MYFDWNVLFFFCVFQGHTNASNAIEFAFQVMGLVSEETQNKISIAHVLAVAGKMCSGFSTVCNQEWG